MMTMVDYYLATEMFEFNALSLFSIALFTYHGGRPRNVCQGQSIQFQGQGQGHKLQAKAKKSGLGPRPRINIHGNN